MKRHFVCLSLPIWGEARPFSQFAAQLIRETDDLVITFLCHGGVSKKLDHEFSRANLTEDETQRLKVFYYGGPAEDGAALLTAAEVYALDRVTSAMFEDWWVKILKVSTSTMIELELRGTGRAATCLDDRAGRADFRC